MTETEIIDSYDRWVERSLSTFHGPESLKTHEASGSASYESKRSLGGARTFLIDNFDDIDDLKLRDCYEDYVEDKEALFISSIFPTHDLLDMIEDRPGHTISIYGYPFPHYSDIQTEFSRLKDNVLIPRYETTYVSKSSQLVRDISGNWRREETNTTRTITTPNKPIFGEAIDTSYLGESVEILKRKGPLRVRMAAVLEPLKVRLVSKGEALPYWLARDFQKSMWNYLQKFPQFALTGRPMSSFDLTGIIEREKKLNLTFPKWVSGDYSAATDGIDYRLTNKVMEVFLRKSILDESLKDLLRGVIGLQFIEYPFKDIDDQMQMNGQLMGSVLSFPILCLINLVAYWRSLEEYLGRLVRMEDLPVLINGDDILFRANDRLYSIWLRRIAEVGFSLSLGKNYLHESLLMINSEMYRYTKGQRDGFNCNFKKIDYLNCGLLTGQSKTSRITDIKPIWDIYNKIIPAAVNPVRAHHRFLHYYKDQINEATGSVTYLEEGKKQFRGGNYNLFLPHERGGLGFQCPLSRFEYRITPFQRKFASFLDEEIKQQLSSGKYESTKISLVRKNKMGIDSIPLDKFQRLMLVPSIGPLEQGHVQFSKPERRLPLLSKVRDTSEPEFQIRQPSKALMRKFREGVFPHMGTKKAMFWPYRLVEKVGI
jgi:hypothetical protein